MSISSTDPNNSSNGKISADNEKEYQVSRSTIYESRKKLVSLPASRGTICCGMRTGLGRDSGRPR